MTWWAWLLLSAGIVVAVWLAFIAWLYRVGRKREARALVEFVPDGAVLFARLLRDRRVLRRRKALLVALTGYLALPFDLVPDVAGR